METERAEGCGASDQMLQICFEANAQNIQLWSLMWYRIFGQNEHKNKHNGRSGTTNWPFHMTVGDHWSHSSVCSGVLFEFEPPKED